MPIRVGATKGAPASSSPWQPAQTSSNAFLPRAACASEYTPSRVVLPAPSACTNHPAAHATPHVTNAAKMAFFMAVVRKGMRRPYPSLRRSKSFVEEPLDALPRERLPHVE